jgi:hypothetical protein
MLSIMLVVLVPGLQANNLVVMGVILLFAWCVNCGENAVIAMGDRRYLCQYIYAYIYTSPLHFFLSLFLSLAAADSGIQLHTKLQMLNDGQGQLRGGYGVLTCCLPSIFWGSEP